MHNFGFKRKTRPRRRLRRWYDRTVIPVGHHTGREHRPESKDGPRRSSKPFARKKLQVGRPSRVDKNLTDPLTVRLDPTDEVDPFLTRMVGRRGREASHVGQCSAKRIKRGGAKPELTPGRLFRASGSAWKLRSDFSRLPFQDGHRNIVVLPRPAALQSLDGKFQRIGYLLAGW